ncbi:hypothetical protein GQ55_3G324400 [Panicum hallii var. hallii]|uniref:Uncharacterized protein n=1 Tax=Panicum hallii var. hallii TaxID=1504633 RepID=A0A2T7EFG6_9POAL|nr:hypothetical protein GQ55_3G324400 [Panicum hallii var. hallii]
MSKTSPASILSLPILFLLLTVTCKAATGAPTSCTAPPCQGKQSWLELVGKDQDTAYLVIRRDNPQVKDVVYLISDAVGHALDSKKDVLGAAADGDFCCNRVVVVLGALSSGGEGVIKVPKVG